jgi:hypothetical protein
MEIPTLFSLAKINIMFQSICYVISLISLYLLHFPNWQWDNHPHGQLKLPISMLRDEDEDEELRMDTMVYPDKLCNSWKAPH